MYDNHNIRLLSHQQGNFHGKCPSSENSWKVFSNKGCILNDLSCFVMLMYFIFYKCNNLLSSKWKFLIITFFANVTPKSCASAL